jgi:hypothetical protein
LLKRINQSVECTNQNTHQCRSDEEEMNAPDDVDQFAATMSAGSGGAGRVEPDDKTVTENESKDDSP